MDAPKTVSWSAIAGGVSARPRDVISGLLGDFSEPKTAKNLRKKSILLTNFFIADLERSRRADSGSGDRSNFSQLF